MVKLVVKVESIDVGGTQGATQTNQTAPAGSMLGGNNGGGSQPKQDGQAQTGGQSAGTGGGTTSGLFGNKPGDTGGASNPTNQPAQGGPNKSAGLFSNTTATGNL